MAANMISAKCWMTNDGKIIIQAEGIQIQVQASTADIIAIKAGGVSEVEFCILPVEKPAT